MNGLKIIRAVVFILTISLIFVFFMFGKIIYNQKKQTLTDNVADIHLSQSFGSEIKNIVAHESNLYIMISGGGSDDRIVVYNQNSNKIIHTIFID